MKHNYSELINISYNKYKLIFVLLILLIMFSFFIFNKTYDTYVTYSTYKDGYYIANIPVENSDSVINGKFVKINNIKLNYEIISVSDLLIEDNYNYQTYILKIKNYSSFENGIQLITFYYNKQRLINKIAKVIV